MRKLLLIFCMMTIYLLSCIHEEPVLESTTIDRVEFIHETNTVTELPEHNEAVCTIMDTIQVISVNSPEYANVEAMELNVSRPSQLGVVGNSLILVSEIQGTDGSLKKCITRYDKYTLEKIAQMMYDSYECFADITDPYIVLLYRDRVEYYHEDLTLVEIMPIPADSIYTKTWDTTEIFHTWEPVAAGIYHIAYTTGELHILNVQTGEEITVSKYGEKYLHVTQIYKMNTDNSFCITAFLKDTAEESVISTDERKIHCVLQTNNGCVMNAVCEKDLKANKLLFCPTDLKLYDISEDIPISWEWCEPLYMSVSQNNSMLKMDVAENLTGGFYGYDVITNQYIVYASQELLRSGGIVYDEEHGYTVVYGESGTGEVYLISYEK